MTTQDTNPARGTVAVLASVTEHGRFGLPALLSKLLVGAGFVPVWLATGVLFAVAAIFAPETLSNNSLSSVLPLMTFLAVAGIGQMLVIMTGGIDLSIPGTITLVAHLVVGVSNGRDGRLALAILVCFGVAALVGLVNGLLISVVQLNPLIVTLAVGQIMLGVSSWYASRIANESSVPTNLSNFSTDRFLGVNTIFWVGVLITVALALFLRQTSVGRRYQTVGANPRAAWIVGLRVRTYVVFGYIAASVLYGAAGLLVAGFIQFPTLDIGETYLLGPIAAVVIGGAALAGGLASVTSTWAGALALTLLSQMLQVMGLSTAWQLVVFGVAIMGGMVISGDRIVGAVGSVLQRPEARAQLRAPHPGDHGLDQEGGAIARDGADL